jgi:mono/diheme cytochrome c family protein
LALSGVVAVGCSSTATAPPLPPPPEAGAEKMDSGSPETGGGSDGSTADQSSPDGGMVTVTEMQIVTMAGSAPSAAAGDAVRLKVVQMLSDGTTRDLPAGTQVTWTGPLTITAYDPADAGSDKLLPDAGASPTGFFVKNQTRMERTDYDGTLFVVDPGTAANGKLMVTATVGDAGLSVAIPVTATPTGDPAAGNTLFHDTLNCAGCHGDKGQGSAADDAGLYNLQGMTYAYPAPGLNAFQPDGGDPNLAADPAWNAALLAVAAQSDVDNLGVALRKPMPDWLGKTKGGPDGGVLSAQDFAHIFAYLKTQTAGQ